jgi:excisionase family DNA binding protein
MALYLAIGRPCGSQHGKEGVRGSSPRVGLTIWLQNDARELLVSGSDEEVSLEVAAGMLGVSQRHLNELLEIESIPYRRVGNQRRIRVADIRKFRERREKAQAGLRLMAEITNKSAGSREKPS